MLEIVASCSCELSLRLVEDVHSCLAKGKDYSLCIILIGVAGHEFINVASVYVAFAHLLFVFIK